MKRVYTSEALPEVGHLKNVLEQHGIACFIKHEQLSGALGEIPFLDCLPELWILDDAEWPRATRLIAQQREPVAAGPAWSCRLCGQQNDAQFAACWRCGAADAQP
ncbi:MAG TPA: DUF2007 domain-containing protein [Gammaproteobacteria bacterium]|nr:DUF2007 domain-containing protein [Gammaproteobacteria bacterium]